MDIKIAEALSLLMMRISSNLDDSTAFVRDHCTAQEFAWYRKVVGKVMGSLYLDIEENLWAEHPGLRPRKMRGTYEVDPSAFEPRFYALRRESDDGR
jgi:hypothetical protein